MHRKQKDEPSLEFFTEEQKAHAAEILHEHGDDGLLMDRRLDDPQPHAVTIETPNGRVIPCEETGKEVGAGRLALTVAPTNAAHLPELAGQTVIFRSREETYAAYVESQTPCHRNNDPTGCVLLVVRPL